MAMGLLRPSWELPLYLSRPWGGNTASSVSVSEYCIIFSGFPIACSRLCKQFVRLYSHCSTLGYHSFCGTLQSWCERQKSRHSCSSCSFHPDFPCAPLFPFSISQSYLGQSNPYKRDSYLANSSCFGEDHVLGLLANLCINSIVTSTIQHRMRSLD